MDHSGHQVTQILGGRGTLRVNAPPAAPVEGDTRALGHAEIGALADHLGPDVSGRDADRVIGAVANSQEFYDAFECKAPERDMCRLW